jgi:hypothetical protein
MRAAAAARGAVPWQTPEDPRSLAILVCELLDDLTVGQAPASGRLHWQVRTKNLNVEVPKSPFNSVVTVISSLRSGILCKISTAAT